jgi:hypothetical protein
VPGRCCTAIGTVSHGLADAVVTAAAQDRSRRVPPCLLPHCFGDQALGQPAMIE